MKLNLVTYFDENYLYRFLALYKSISKYNKDFHFYVIVLGELNVSNFPSKLENVTLIDLETVENYLPELHYAKKNRSLIEYYFTLTPSVILFTLKNYKIEIITYIDADTCFFSDPLKVYEKYINEDTNILITSHNLDNWSHGKKYGKYNVGWIVFKNSDVGLKCLRNWFNQCINWCFDKSINNKYADQKYLDEWPGKYEGVKVVGEELINIGPWNFSKITKKNNHELILYHFHNVKFLNKFIFTTNISGFFSKPYFADRNLVKKIYCPYIDSISKNKIELKINRNKRDFFLIKNLFKVFMNIIRLDLYYKK